MAVKTNEILWVTYISNEQITHCITSNKDRSVYYLYEYTNDDFVKTTHKAEEPIELEQFIEHKQTNTTKPKTVKETSKLKTTTNKNSKTTSKPKLLKESVTHTKRKKGSLF